MPPTTALRPAAASAAPWLKENDGLERVIFCVFGEEVAQAYRRALGR